MNKELTSYQASLQKIASPEENKERTRFLIQSTAEMMKHFFDKSTYGDPDLCGPGTLPAYWAYVRYLVADRLRPKFGYGSSKFTDIEWTEKLLQDFSSEAQELEKLLPTDLNHHEWLFMVRVAGHMLMNDPLLVENGYINEEGRQRLINQSMLAGSAPGDMYEAQFEDWKEQFSNPTVTSPPSHRVIEANQQTLEQ